MKMATRKGISNLRPERVADALKTAKGIISVAAEILGCSRNAVYENIKKHPEVRQAQEDADEAVTDFAEIKLMKKLNEGDMRAILFRLETKGKKRGYVRRNEFSGPDGDPIPAEFTLTFTK